MLDVHPPHPPPPTMRPIPPTPWQGTSEAALHGVQTTAEMNPYIQRAMAALPK
jgi:hypothetical protein